jgi:NADPH:quinone reductase-like Zn-dependent oxidoreductase
MKAAVIHEHGGPEVITVDEVPDPTPGPGEVVVDVFAAALNHLDIWVRKGGRMDLDMPHVLGSDAAGIVSAVGDDVTRFERGDEVVINPGLPCGECEHCLAGQQSVCDSFSILGAGPWGTFAQKVAVPARCLAPKPAHLTFPDAAALPLAHMTAWRMLITRGRLKPGETVLIHGIGGGVALAGLQIAKLTGARVIATSSSNSKLALAEQLGADHLVNYNDVDDVGATARGMTGGRGVDLVMDSVGAATWPADFDAVRRGGRIVLCGVTTGAEAPTDLRALYWNQIEVLGSTMGSDKDFSDMLNAVNTTRISPVLDRVYGLEQIQDATERMEHGKQIGKIVLQMRGTIYQPE